MPNRITEADAYAMLSPEMRERAMRLNRRCEPVRTSAAERAPKRPRQPNRWESAYARELEARRVAGEVTWWAYEPLRFRIGEGAWYKPDFIVVHIDGAIEAVEIKGHEREAAVVRFKAAADRYPWVRWTMVRRVRDGWEVVRRSAPRDQEAA